MHTHRLAPTFKWIALPVLAIAPLMAVTLNPACDAANKIALRLAADGRLGEAEAEYSKLIAPLHSSAEDKLCRGVTLNNLAGTLVQAGKLDAAAHTAAQAATLLEEILGADSPSLRHSLLIVAQVALTNGHLSKTGKLLSRLEALPDKEPSDVALTNGLRAILWREEGKPAQSEAAYRRAIAAWEAAGQGWLPNVVPELTNLSIFYITESRTEEALVLLDRAIRITGTGSVDATLRTKTLIVAGVAHAKARNREQAETYFRQAMDLLPDVPPATQPAVGRGIYLHYATLLRDTGRKREARALEQQATALFGPEIFGMVVDVNGLLPKAKLK